MNSSTFKKKKIVGFALNHSKPERMNLLYTVRCHNHKVIYGDAVKPQDPTDDVDEEANDDIDIVAAAAAAAANPDEKPARKDSDKHEEKVEILSLQFNPQSNLLATGNSNGQVHVHDIFSGLQLPGEDDGNDKFISQISRTVSKGVASTPKSATYNMPISALKWYPYSQYSTNLLFFAHVNGYVSVLNRHSMKKCLIIEEEDEVKFYRFI